MAKSLDVQSNPFVPTNRPANCSKPQEPKQSTAASENFSSSLLLPSGSPDANQGSLVFNEGDSLEFKVTGRLKFFNEGQNYGFIVSDIDGKDLFFHYDDMKKTNLSKQFLKDAKNRFIVRFQFKVMAYYGKYNLSKKAVDIDLLKIEPIAFDVTQQVS
eukprot:CAMPEP_0202977618 /NCGR_PEP_ID=MMETSP1396-20130829/84356_1 /ASSEMBLY_ACC=CAM_ASM_000872 /TAXON_ID= /ORGANISM="Pseudokeronopsis sp., Strain Brazil" /LENGTH=157 /DNA_ID=CAMNT_0049716399 /DNA_START=1678 /DNA_END=2151 /DNA_ORIENTATION=+